MEFHITLSGIKPDAIAIQQAVRAVDPAALVDIDPSTHVLRIAASIGGTQMAELIREAGFPVAPQHVFQVPSVCCGGCSG